MDTIKISEMDNVVVALRDIAAGETLPVGSASFVVAEPVKMGHKIAAMAIKKGDNVIKYGFPIGHAVEDIEPGRHVHTHNTRTNLSDKLEYKYEPKLEAVDIPTSVRGFRGYRRSDGRVGTRNEIWIIPTVSCVNRNAQLIAAMAEQKWAGVANIDGIHAVTHPYGCSQLGQDQLNTQKILARLTAHPNAGGVLILGLGCENNNIAEFKKVLGHYDERRVKFLVAQDVEDEIAAGLELVSELAEQASSCRREECPLSDLTLGLKCGGSDGLSGITANPLLGIVSDSVVSRGGSTILTEVPEMFGAETLLMGRAVSLEVFNQIVAMINQFKQYYMDHHQPIYENPSPGNKAGGITTLEEKSLGCTQKGGRGIVRDVIGYGEAVKAKGLTLLTSPGNDMVASTALAAAGCQIILFTTGRGTPLGTVVPTVKVATNSQLYKRKSTWMDFDAGRLLTGESLPGLGDDLLRFVSDVASGMATKSEQMGFREIAIFKNGVTL